MYALGVSFLLATSHAFAPMGGRVQTRMNKLSMSTMVSPVATEAILATVRHNLLSIMLIIFEHFG